MLRFVVVVISLICDRKSRKPAGHLVNLHTKLFECREHVNRNARFQSLCRVFEVEFSHVREKTCQHIQEGQQDRVEKITQIDAHFKLNNVDKMRGSEKVLQVSDVNVARPNCKSECCESPVVDNLRQG